MGTLDDDKAVLSAIKRGFNTLKVLAEHTQLGEREVDRACQRLKKRGEVKYAGRAMGWIVPRDSTRPRA